MKDAMAALMISIVAAGTLPPGSVRAQITDSEPKLYLELNNLSVSETGCLATFLIKNNFDSSLEKGAFEIVLFDKSKKINRLMILDFSPLTTGKTQVRQFDLAATRCDGIGRVLINDSASCEGGDLPDHACLTRLETRTRQQIEFGS
ncbi:hypothetical protein [Hoeflea sp. TYP-13]|uniref:hypothetical protein n=1 Tax=Hoeflea sp. TYP-13 TaxID=3230023 RepID=UPI0034C65C73